MTKTDCFSPNDTGTRQMSADTALFSTVQEPWLVEEVEKKDIKGKQISRKSKRPFTDSMIASVENSREPTTTTKLSILTGQFSKITGCKISNRK